MLRRTLSYKLVLPVWQLPHLAALTNSYEFSDFVLHAGLMITGVETNSRVVLHVLKCIMLETAESVAHIA